MIGSRRPSAITRPAAVAAFRSVMTRAVSASAMKGFNPFRLASRSDRAVRNRQRVLASLVCLVVVAGFLDAGPVGAMHLAGLTVSPPVGPPIGPVTIGTVQGKFFPSSSPSNGVFDISPSATPAFTQQFPVIDFNPPAAAQVLCGSSTGISEFSRPFTDVVRNSNGSCATVVVQGNGEQAGMSSLAAFEAVFTAPLTVAQAGQVTFNFYSDDGWILSAGRGAAGGQPAYVSGSRVNAPASGAFTGYTTIGAYNEPTPPIQSTVTVSFPAAGTYPIEVDYTECCGGQESLVLGTSFGNPIPPSGTVTIGPGTPVAGPAISGLSPASGPYYGGTAVTINGSGLAGGTVSFGGPPATIVSSSDTQIVVKTGYRAPTADASTVDVRVTTSAGTSGVSPSDRFTYRGVAVVLLQGWTTKGPSGPIKLGTFPAGVKDPGTFMQPGGLVDSLLATYHLPVDTIQQFSYANANVFGASYGPCDTLNHISTSVARLNAQLNTYAGSHKDIDVYLVGHSQGGMVALGYLASLAKTGSYATPFPGVFPDVHLAGVVTLDSPLGGVDLAPLGIAETAVLGNSNPLNLLGIWTPEDVREQLQIFLKSNCPKLNLAVTAEDLADIVALGTPGGILRGWPWGGTGSIPKLFGMTDPTDNTSLAKDAVSAGVRVLTVGNLRDLTMSSTGFGSTQWVADGGRSGVYARTINTPETCRLWDWGCYSGHGAALTDKSVHDAIWQFMNGKAPGLAVPGSWLDVAASATWGVGGGIISAANGLISLAAPAGSVASPGPVSLTSVSTASIVEPIPAGQALAGPAMSVTMPPLVAGSSATLTLPVDLSVLGLTSTAAIFRDGAWVRMPTKIDLATGIATATITEGGVYAPLSIPLKKVVLSDAIGAGIRRGTTGFTTGTVTIPAGGWVTYKVTTKPRLAGKSVTIWSRVGTGMWRKVATRAVASDGTVRYDARVRSRTTFRATFLGDGTTAAATSTGRTVLIR